eukprot:7486542-Pyramimonas_sp.AAC.1
MLLGSHITRKPGVRNIVTSPLSPEVLVHPHKRHGPRLRDLGWEATTAEVGDDGAHRGAGRDFLRWDTGLAGGQRLPPSATGP